MLLLKRLVRFCRENPEVIEKPKIGASVKWIFEQFDIYPHRKPDFGMLDYHVLSLMYEWETDYLYRNLDESLMLESELSAEKKAS